MREWWLEITLAVVIVVAAAVGMDFWAGGTKMGPEIRCTVWGIAQAATTGAKADVIDMLGFDCADGSTARLTTRKLVKDVGLSDPQLLNLRNKVGVAGSLLCQKSYWYDWLLDIPLPASDGFTCRPGTLPG